VAARTSWSHDTALVAALLLGALTLAPCAPRDASDPSASAGVPASDPGRRAAEDRIAALDAGVSRMRSVRSTDHAKDGSTSELVAWLDGDSIVVIQGAARHPDGNSSDFRYYYDGPRVVGFRRNDLYPTGPPGLAGKTLQSAAYFAPDGRLVLWSQTVDGKPSPLRADRREGLVRQWVDGGGDWRRLLTRFAADSLGLRSERGSTP